MKLTTSAGLVAVIVLVLVVVLVDVISGMVVVVTSPLETCRGRCESATILSSSFFAGIVVRLRSGAQKLENDQYLERIVSWEGGKSMLWFG